MSNRASSRFAIVAGWALLAGAGVFGGITQASATGYPPPNCLDPLVGPTSPPNPGDPDITTSVVSKPASGTRSIIGSFPQDNYVSYEITLTQYRLHAERFDPVVFKATATAVNGAVGYETDVGQAAFLNSSLPAACEPTAANSITCTFHDVANSTVAPNPPPPAKTFSVVVKTPTAGEKIKLTSQTFWKEPDESPRSCESEQELTTRTALTNPTEAVNTVLLAPGTVKTGTTGGAATTSQPWVTTVKVPAPAQVGVDLTEVDVLCPDCSNFSKIDIPGGLYGWGLTEAARIRWYEEDAKSKLLVITLRKDVDTVVGSDPVKKALQILKEKIYYKPDATPANPNPSFQQVLLCLVTAGPTPGNPCIAYARVYTRFNAPNVTNRDEYFGDHEWVIFANENGKFGAP